jgi:lipopolysaccharide transport system ATP-binding protein
VQQGEALGVIGRNGAGKSTLLKILSRVTAPTSGVVKIKGRIGSLLEVGSGFHAELTGRENVYLNGALLGMKKADVSRKFDEIVDFSGVEKFIDTPVKRYSSGMYVRLAFAVAAHLDPEILIVDEVLAVGDAEFQKKCLGKMGDVAGEGRTVLFVSHNMNAILNLCQRCLVIQNGKVGLDSNSEEAIQFHLHSGRERDIERENHVVYLNDTSLPDQEIAKITQIEILDINRKPKPFLQTWDEVIFRITYYSKQAYPNGSFILDLSDFKQNRLVVFDSGSQVPIETDEHSVECFISRFPLSAGEYLVGGGLTLPRAGFIDKYRNDLGLIQVHGKDVFNLGRPPEMKRMLFVQEHSWKRS